MKDNRLSKITFTYFVQTREHLFSIFDSRLDPLKRGEKECFFNSLVGKKMKRKASLTLCPLWMLVVKVQVKNVKLFNSKFRLPHSSQNVIYVKCEHQPHNCDVGPTGNKFKLLQLNTRENKASC
jgi:hypothetical protein